MIFTQNDRTLSIGLYSNRQFVFESDRISVATTYAVKSTSNDKSVFRRSTP